MTDKQRYICLSEAANYSDRDAYISDMALSSIWGDDADADIPAERIEELGKLYDLYRLSIRDIRKQTGLSQAAFGTRYFIPRRTIEAWETGVRVPPVYIKILLAESAGLWHR